MAVATVADVADSLGRPISDDLEVIQVARWLDDAELQIRVRLGDVSLLDQAVLAFVEREAVILKIRNPAGKQSEQIDDYSYRREDSTARGQVQILSEWWLMLAPGGDSGAFTITPYSTTYVAEALPPLMPEWDVNP